MKIRLLALTLILVLIAGIVPFAAAQDTPDPKQELNCLGLSADDCTIVQTSMDNMSKVNSVSPTVQFTIAIAGASAVAPGMAMDTSTDLQATGAVVIDHEAAASDKPYKGVTLSFDVTGTSNSGTKASPMNVSFALVDGVVYFKDDSGAWKGIAIDDLMSHPEAMQAIVGNMPGTSMMGMDLGAQMMPGMMGQMDQMGTLDPTKSDMANPMLSSLLATPGFLSQTRLADETLMGQNMHVFAYTGDIATALQSADLQKALTDAFTGGAAAGGSAAPGGMGGQMGMMIPALLQSTTGTVTLTRWIGADDQFVHQVSLVVDTQIDLFGGMSSSSSKVTPIPPITVKVNMTVSLDKINDTAAPTAPEGATIISAADLIPTPEGTPEATPAQ